MSLRVWLFVGSVLRTRYAATTIHHAKSITRLTYITRSNTNQQTSIMRITIFLFLLTILTRTCIAQNPLKTADIDHAKIKQDFDQIIKDLSTNYIYLSDKEVDFNCIKEYYLKQIDKLKTEEQTVLFFEYLLDEFYDSHLILNTNRKSSFRLYAPIYATINNGKPIISSIWISQIEPIAQPIIGAEILKLNETKISKAIQQFPTHCTNKKSKIAREWIVNKLLAGRYNEPRILTLKLTNGTIIDFDLNTIAFKQSRDLLTSTTKNKIGIIRINNSLGNNELIYEFDKSLDDLMNTEGLIIDLRNTVDGGNSYVARGIMGRFIDEPKPYQKHELTEKYGNNPKIKRSWIEYVSPRKEQYKKPVIVLVGRWTGSMGEGLAIGFEGIQRAKIVGTEMERLAGEMNGFSFKNQNYGYRLSTAKLFHINGEPREKYTPKNYIKQSSISTDETLLKGIELIKKITTNNSK